MSSAKVGQPQRANTSDPWMQAIQTCCWEVLQNVTPNLSHVTFEAFAEFIGVRILLIEVC